ncbi:GNAT family N-acetyltransferase [Roseomonas fluvialis]|uniref:N-acetyltransferase GCN5 n=1 Tax=Roseomonas fluvialis TaxID=1750527 RepID=A0ABM7Y019_9PROT|nr:GNAT family N-acetyltransferase [Roseomonas fluvialis]BDG71103.1 N-acetyltransferase GCN5 [Roseomonas fluvialis]
MIRTARPAEADDVAAMFNAINSLDGPGPVVPMTGAHVRHHLLGPNPLSMLRVAEADGVLAGFVTGNIVFDSTRAAGGCIVVDLFVRPEFRRRGIARALMAALAAETRAAGAVCLWWGVDDGDDEASAFYDSIGAVIEEHFTGRLLAGAAYDTLAAEATP